MTRILFSFSPGIDYTSLHDEYRRKNPETSFIWDFSYTLPIIPGRADSFFDSDTSIQNLLVIANRDLYAIQPVQKKIDRYIRDIRTSFGCEVTLLTAKGGSAEDIKFLIYQQHVLSELDGVVLIGRLPAAWFEVPNDHYWWEGGYGYADWTCDLFFMDLDGLWEDADANGKYDSHEAGSGDIDPEIFLGRIDPSSMGYYGSEADLLCRYLDKNHRYWKGKLRLPRFGLVYTDHDWSDYSTYYFRYLYGTGGYDNLKWQDSTYNKVKKHDYLNNRLPFAFYGFTQIWTHATHELHSFHTGGACYQREVRSRNPMSVGYVINGCHSCDWAAGNGVHFLGGSYVYNESPSSLAAIGTTKVGGMLEFESFYDSLGQNASLGSAFVHWFSHILHSQEERGYIIGWHYGMTIVGDPMIAFQQVPGTHIIEPQIYPPIDFSVSRVENRSLFMREYINMLTWQPNPENSHGLVAYYRLYEVTSDKLIPIAELSPEALSYWFREVEERTYYYALASVDQEGRESYLVFRSDL
jgi:hypothetical protein